MFWDRLKSLCDERNIAPTVLAKKNRIVGKCRKYAVLFCLI
jgi:hypothetical protein